MTSDPTLPSFLIIGEQKCGTGWLRDRLLEHPDVFIAPKEVNFFSHKSNFERGITNYAKAFEHPTREVRGEKSPEYFWQNSGREDYNQDIFGLINEALPEARILLSLRSPVERAISALLHHVRHRGRRIHPSLVNNKPASEFILSANYDLSHLGILERGFYADRVAKAIDIFGDRLKILIFEDDIVANPEKGLEKICLHIGVGMYDGFSFHSNAKSVKPSYLATWISYYAPVLRPLIRKLDFGSPFRLNTTEACRKALWDCYFEDVKQLEVILGKGPLFGRPL